MKKNKIINLSLILCMFTIICLSMIFPFNVSSNSINTISENNNIKVSLSGDSIGLSIGSRVEILGFDDNIPDDNPLEKGDIIISIDNKKVKSIDDIKSFISNYSLDTVKIKVLRDNKMISTEIKIINNTKNERSLGIYVKDKILGIGTLTFVNIDTLKFASLGHGVTNAYSDGLIYNSTVESIRKAVDGISGEKIASINGSSIGKININNDLGIFGDVLNNNNNNIIELCNAEDIKTGSAQILTVIEGNKKEYFDIEILEVKKYETNQTKGIKYKVIDEELITKTGGIICGMSGSPIIQNDRLVGAVSHVTVEDPQIGYGVIAQWMYNYTK